MIQFPTPGFDIEIVVKTIARKLAGANPRGYGVCITDAEEKYIKWKYNSQYKEIVHCEILGDAKLASQLRTRLMEEGFWGLENDPIVGINCDDKCRILFVRRLLPTEISELEAQSKN
jgi:hypothetical protein